MRMLAMGDRGRREGGDLAARRGGVRPRDRAAHIWNDGTGTPRRGNYAARFWKRRARPSYVSEVRGFSRQSRDASVGVLGLPGLAAFAWVPTWINAVARHVSALRAEILSDYYS